MQRTVGRKAHLKQVPLDQVEPENLEVEQVWNDIWQQEVLQQALATARTELANDQTFSAFELHVLKGHSVNEVMSRLKLSQSAVYRAKSRVAGLVQKHLRVLSGEDEAP
jgi:hypothetical protein